jgi:predicted GNAT family acetyltransferase
MLDAWMPFLEAIPSGLIKSGWDAVTDLWHRLGQRGRGCVVDRGETAYWMRPDRVRAVAPAPGVELRVAGEGDLDALVAAARASLREEGRPDPFDGDPSGFRRWVRSRLPRARVVESEGEVRFVCYADVRRSEGWLVQGVYTFPSARRRGFAAAGMSGLAAEAFAAGADHVQLAVVSGNTAAVGLYEKLGFEPFARLRTVLFI